jgi:fructose-bisphosphate aldolase class I
MNARFRGRVLAFSFARAIQQPTLEIGGGHEDKVDWAQHALSYRAKCNRAARRGNFPAALEGE